MIIVANSEKRERSHSPIALYILYSPENKPPPLFDLQVLAQVFLPRV